MFKLNKKVEYAIIALKHMDGKSPDDMSTVKEICEIYGAPFDVTSRSMQKLAAAGILKSEKGAQGGYLIKKNLADVKLLDLIELVTGTVALASCVSETCKCNMIETCNIVGPVTRLNHLVREFFAGMTVKDLIEEKSHANACEESFK